MKLVAEGTDVQQMSEADSSFSPGDTGEIRFFVDHLVDQSTLDSFEDQLVAEGMILTQPIRQEEGIVIVSFQKPTGIGVLPLIIGAGIIAAGLFAFGSWQVYRTVRAIPSWVLLVGGALGAFLLYKMMKPTVKYVAPVTAAVSPTSRVGKAARAIAASRNPRRKR